MKELPITDSLEGVGELSEQAYQMEIPGFQIEPSLALQTGAITSLLSAIEDGSRVIYSGTDLFVPFTHRNEEPNAGNFAPHVDAGNRGLAVHQFRGRSITGHVELALADIDTSTGPAIFGQPEDDARVDAYKGSGIAEACKDVPHGEIYSGPLVFGKLTVFSQGGLPGLMPAIHYFERENRSPAPWRRFSSKRGDNARDHSHVLKRSTQLKNGIDYNEAQQLFDLKSRYDVLSPSLNPLGLSLEEVKAAYEVHPGRQLRSLGMDQEIDMPSYRQATAFDRLRAFRK